MKLRNRAKNAGQRIIVFGAPKTGKSELVGKLAKKFKLLWFDLEKGAGVLLKMPEEWQDNVELIDLPDTRTFPIAIETMLKVIKGTPCDICHEHGKVSCQLCKKEGKESTTVCLNDLAGKVSEWIVVVDSLTQLANSAMAHITKNLGDDYKYEWDDYRKQGTLMDKFLSDVQQARYNIICISHETQTEMDDGKTKLVPVAGTTNFSRNTAKYFDHVVHTEVKNRKHVFGSGTGFSITALTGSRSNVHIENQKEGEQSLLPFFPTFEEQFGSGKTEAGVIEDAAPDATERSEQNASISRLEQLRASHRK